MELQRLASGHHQESAIISERQFLLSHTRCSRDEHRWSDMHLPRKHKHKWHVSSICTEAIKPHQSNPRLSWSRCFGRRSLLDAGSQRLSPAQAEGGRIHISLDLTALLPFSLPPSLLTQQPSSFPNSAAVGRVEHSTWAGQHFSGHKLELDVNSEFK
ncbi:protein SSUH2-like protein [Platysternon megacephalum]|uniref:Protein SSUH2-like protein n=1 Tax=Platysternon megacephalum TaxID=55544 RepID=A0A4D9E621_9SAUR|nr:protein SSUH2-like protein [Platysternon megacephalum]